MDSSPDKGDHEPKSESNSYMTSSHFKVAMGSYRLNKLVFSLVLLIVLISISILPIFAEAADWIKIEDEYFIVYYQSGYEDDALKILKYADYARQVLLDFIPYELDEKVKIYVYPVPSITESGWYITYGHMSADYMGKSICLIAPSEALKRSPYYDDAWHKKNIIHEYAHVIVGSLVYEKQKRYMGDYLPMWFQEGLAEYAAIFLSDDPEIIEKYSSQLEEVKDLVRGGRGFFITVASDIHYGGAYLVYFLRDTYGKNLIMNLLAKSYPDFYTALEEETGKSIRELENEWLRWACSKFGVDFGKVYGEALATVKMTVTVTESVTRTLTDKITLTETHTITKTAYTTITTTKLTPVTKTLTEIKTSYETRIIETAGEKLSTTLIALIAVVIMGLCLLIALTLLLRKREI